MSSLFPRSVLLTQDAVGHTSLAATSNCTAHNVQQYLTGTMPAENTTCRTENVPFITET